MNDFVEFDLVLIQIHKWSNLTQIVQINLDQFEFARDLSLWTPPSFDHIFVILAFYLLNEKMKRAFGPEKIWLHPWLLKSRFNS